jgi:subtilase-type serine protease
MKTAALKQSVLSTFTRKTLSRNVLSLVLAGCASAGWAVPFDIAANTTATGVRTLVAGETGTVNQGASLSASDKTITWSGASAGTVTINNQGTVRATANGGRAIDTSSSGGAWRSLILQNGVNGQILGGNDAVRINFSSGTVGSVAVDNAGSIYSASGQALDFNAIEKGTVEIVNQATGVISTKDADGVRPGANGTVINYGKIIGGGAGLVAGATNLSSEAIDFQDFGGTVHNKTGGIINGGRHGITGDGVIDVTNAVGGLIRGHNGSGINLDNTGSVVNHGIISGNFDATLINGDGDGVDIDGVGRIDNYGRIEANGAGGVKNGPTDPNRADGIAMGGGIINNYLGATIYSADRGILIDDSEAGAAFGKTTLVNHGVIDAQTTGVTLQGEWDDYLLNTGTIRSRTGDVAIDMGGGNDTLVVKTGSVVEGSVRGGTGTNQLVLSGSGSGQLGLTQEFGSIQIEGGNWSLGGEQQLMSLQGTGSLAAQSIALFADSSLTVGNLDGSGGALNLLSDVKVGGTVALDFWGTGAQDSLAVTGLFDLLNNGSLQLNFVGNDFADGQMFTFLSASRFSGLDYSRFAVSGLGSDWQWEFNQFNVADYDAVSVKLNRAVTSVSEPSSLALLLVALMSLVHVHRSRRA